jgi:hypothetical protein
MSLNLQLQALPDGCPLLARAAADRDRGELLQFLPGCLQSLHAAEVWRPWPLDTQETEVLEECRRLLRQDPDVHSRRVALDADWDSLHHLLSSARASGDPAAYTDAGSVLVRGAEELGPGCVGVQGIPIRWTPPGRAARAFMALQQLTEDDVAARYDWQAMLDLGIYKHPHSREYAAKELEYLLGFWRNLTAFYGDAIRMGYGVLHILD